VITPPVRQYAVAVEFTQGGGKLGAVTASGESDSPTVTVQLFAQLAAGP
jgi:hypothetical protein